MGNRKPTYKMKSKRPSLVVGFCCPRDRFRLKLICLRSGHAVNRAVSNESGCFRKESVTSVARVSSYTPGCTERDERTVILDISFLESPASKSAEMYREIRIGSNALVVRCQP